MLDLATINAKLDFILEQQKSILLLLEPPVRPVITFSDWLLQWISEFRTNVSTSTLYKDTNNIKNQIIPKIGNVNLEDINTLILQKFFNSLTAPRQKEHIYVLIKHALRKAVDLKMIEENPCMNVVIPKHTPKSTAILTPTQAEVFLSLSKASKHYKAFYVLLNQGLRPSELLALTLDNILDNHIRVTQSWNSQHKILSTTKTTQSVREIPYFGLSKKYLSYRSKTNTARIFPIQLRTLEDEFKKIIGTRDFLECLVPRVSLTLYSLRHTCITRWAEDGVHSKVVMKWSGHVNIATTMHYYTHISTEWEQKEIKKTIKKD